MTRLRGLALATLVLAGCGIGPKPEDPLSDSLDDGGVIRDAGGLDAAAPDAGGGADTTVGDGAPTPMDASGDAGDAGETDGGGSDATDGGDASDAGETDGAATG